MVVADGTNRKDHSIEGQNRATRIHSRSVFRWLKLVKLLPAAFFLATLFLAAPFLASPAAQAGCTAGQASSEAFRSAEAKPARSGELTLKFYLRYESGRFWFTNEPPAPTCSGPECNADSKMKTAPALEFQVRSTVLSSGFPSEKTFFLDSGFAAEVPCESQRANRGFIEVVEPPPKRV
jgi:hypothetical protein